MTASAETAELATSEPERIATHAVSVDGDAAAAVLAAEVLGPQERHGLRLREFGEMCLCRM